MGHMRYVTHWDWVRLRRHYNCPGAWQERTIQEVKEEVDRTLPLMMAVPPSSVADDGTLDNEHVDTNVQEDEIVDQ